MNTLATIRQVVDIEFETFSTRFEQEFHSGIPLLDQLLKYTHQHIGKQVRPIFMLLLGKMCGEVNDKIYASATAFEMVHTASLIHDDIVDEALERHSAKSVHSAFNNTSAVLVGDFLMSRSIRAMNETKDVELFDCLSKVGQLLSEGELIQLDNKLNTNEEIYYNIIRHKTAVLFEQCARATAITLHHLSDKEKRAMQKIGELVGLIFQIKDDTFDYLPDSETGKPKYNDIIEHKITLPLLYALNHCDIEDRNRVMDILKKTNLQLPDLDGIRDFVLKNKGLRYTTRKMQELKQNAFELLDLFEDNIYRQSVRNLIDFVIERNI